MTLDYRRMAQMRISAVDWCGDTVEAWYWATYDYRDLEISQIRPPVDSASHN